VTPHAAAHSWPRRTSLPSVFTAFVRSLHGEETPDADLFHDAWHGLRSVLVHEMKRRGVWQTPPEYLGVYGHERWDAEEGARDPRAPDRGAALAQVGALGELVADCYACVFVDRLPGLRRRLADHQEIDGLVRLNVRHFLHERQRHHDPLGFRIFELLHGAVAEAVARGALRVAAGDERIRNDTLLAFETGTPERNPPADLAGAVMRWNNELLPALMTARSRQQAALVERLAQLLLELPRQGVHAFRFREILDPLKSDARRRWAALLADPPGEGSVAGAADPAGGQPAALIESPGQSRRSLRQLDHCVSAAIGRAPADERTRTQLAALWQHLRRQQQGDETRDDPDEDGLPGAGPGRTSHRQLARQLEISRGRLPALFALLRKLVAQCRACRTPTPRP
jgi:hypothetical protein